ncbi:hypothetical protein ACFSR9_08900 [Deinococcus taklimakanensis]|uniref:Uncharacterized protein n=1 Tax=Deinococcus taklimakanensis TaxID=536443 RepID=A0ABW5P2S4_9DEIO
MTNEQQFVALKPFRFGTGVLQPGDPVPVEAGRDYRLMQRLGQIAPVSVTAPAAAQQEEPLLTPYEAGESVYFISEDGAATLVTFHEALEAPDDVREGLGLKEGDVVASVTFPDDGENATFVPLGSLLPEQPTARLIEELQAEAALSVPADVDRITALEGRTAFLELLVQAIRMEGAPLPDDLPSVKDLRTNGISTAEGLALLAAGEHGRANLVALDRIGEKSAEKILAYLHPVPGA